MEDEFNKVGVFPKDHPLVALPPVASPPTSPRRGALCMTLRPSPLLLLAKSALVLSTTPSQPPPPPLAELAEKAGDDVVVTARPCENGVRGTPPSVERATDAADEPSGSRRMPGRGASPKPWLPPPLGMKIR